MPKPKLIYVIEDKKTADDNLADLKTSIEKLDANLAAVLNSRLSILMGGDASPSGLWNALFDAAGPPTAPPAEIDAA